MSEKNITSKAILKSSILLLLLLCNIICLKAQKKDTTATKKDSAVAISSPTIEAEIVPPFPDSTFHFNVKKPIPKRAGLYSACLPGLGQVYNKQYWKLGVVIAAAGVTSGFMISNYREYNKYRKIYIGMIDSNPETPNTFENYTVDDVKFLRDGFRKYLEYSVIAGSLGYILNILDAFISAHLKSFDMSKDLSFQLMPSMNQTYQASLSLKIPIK